MTITHDLDMRALRAFVAVADCLTFSAAAHALHITQPALSRRIHQLESALDLRLFDRNSRRVRLTGEGEALLDRTRRLLQDAQDMQERARALKGGNAGVLRVGSTPFAHEVLMAPFLAGYRKRFPGVDVQLIEQGGGARVLEGLRSGVLHVGVVNEGEPDIATRPLFPWRIVAVVPRSHGLARRKAVDIRALASEPLLLLTPDFITRRLFDAACETLHLRPVARMQSATPHTLVAMAAAGYGVAVVPSAMPIAERRLKVLPVLAQGQSLGRRWAIGWDPLRHQPECAKRFIDGLAEFARQHYVGRAYQFKLPGGRQS